MYVCVAVVVCTRTSQDNASRFYFSSLLRLVQQTKCLKIRGKDDIDWDNLFRGKNKTTSQKKQNKTAPQTLLLVGKNVFSVGLVGIPIAGREGGRSHQGQETWVSVLALLPCSHLPFLLFKGEALDPDGRPLWPTLMTRQI